MEDVFIEACKVRDELRDRLNSQHGTFTVVLHQHRKLVKDYIKADQAVHVWEEALYLPERS